MADPHRHRDQFVSNLVLLQLLSSLPKARHWLKQTNDAHRESAGSILNGPNTRLLNFYPLAILRQAQIVIVDQVPRPPLEQWNLHAADDFNLFEASGITLGNFIFIRRDCHHGESLLFHELVHLVQYRILGVNAFLALYGVQLLQHGYHSSPLETMAYQLQAQFDKHSSSFDAPTIIKRRTQEMLAHFRKQSKLQWAMLMAMAGTSLFRRSR